MVFMRYTLLVFLLPFTIAHSVPSSSSTTALTHPTPIACPKGGLPIRSVGNPTRQSLSPDEKAYISTRSTKVLPEAWLTYLKSVQAISSSSSSSSKSPIPQGISEIIAHSHAFDEATPKLGIAVSGGSYRAALFGAAVLNSLDARNNTSVHQTGTGGLLQAASYLSGLSGGAWLVTSLIQANFPTIQNLIFPHPSSSPTSSSSSPNAVFGGFLAQFDLIQPSLDPNISLAFLEALIAEVAPKFQVGLPITITDPWSRTLARHFINGTTVDNILQEGVHGAGVLFSDIVKLPSFLNHQQPFPIIVADSIPPTPDPRHTAPDESVPFSSEIWEINPFETGSYDPALGSFIPTSLLGSFNSSHCFAGFDQAAYIAGISSNLFNGFNTSASAIATSPIASLIEIIQVAFGVQKNVRLDSAAVPNPFKGVNPRTFKNTDEEFVTLVDGGSDGEVIPLQPLLVRSRGLDTIIAIDATADTVDNWTNGSSLINAAKRAALLGNTYPFPHIPSSPSTFTKNNLTRHPTFFGCDENDGVTPLIIYIANGGPPVDDEGGVPLTNASTLQTTFSSDQVQAFLNQAFDIATQGIPVTNVVEKGHSSPHSQGLSAHWGTCLACAVAERARARTRIPRDEVCTKCFARYCWDGRD